MEGLLSTRPTGRVAEKSNPSNLDCIQIEISASNLMPKFTQFLSQNEHCRMFRLFCITFSVLTKFNCKLYKLIGCRHTVYKYWMQHCCLYTKCFQCEQLSYKSNNRCRPTCSKTVLDADKLVPIYASKVFQIPSNIVIQQK